MSYYRIDKLFYFEKGTLQSSKCTPGDYDFITAAAEWKTHNSYTHDCEALVFAAAASGSLGRIHYVKGKFIASDLCFILTPKDSINYPIDLRFYQIIFNLFRDSIVNSTKAGTSKEAIGLTRFGKYELPYFELDHQINVKERIQCINEITKTLTEEKGNQYKLLTQLRQSFLREAMQGKLVPQDPNDEPASELLKRIKGEKEKQADERRIRDNFENNLNINIPFDIPISWRWCSLNDISYVGTGATPNTSNSDYYKNGSIAWITSSSTNDLYVNKADKYITEKALKETNCKIYPKGTLIVAMYGQGKTRGQITELNFNAATNQACAVILLYLKDDNLKNYVKYFFRFVYNELRELAQGGSQPNLNLTKIKNTLLPIPPLTEQQRIVTKLNELMQFCDQLEQNINVTKEQTNLLLQVVLREALEGKNN